ncbi:hypothetical protein DOY81_007284 [Sarcophaga bullata]|nr:hypothetical protein DOY81_007284 [Sarcophaga bullata]
MFQISLLSFAILLAMAEQLLAIVCPTTPIYKQELVPDCLGANENVLWPSYEDISSYFRCQGVGNPVLASCPYKMVFNFRQQRCTGCNEYDPAPACSDLKLATGKPKCVTLTLPTTVPPPATKPTTTTTTTPGPVPNCPAIKAYTETFTPTCSGRDQTILWPNYANPSEYYRCLDDELQLVTCAYKMYFNFYQQRCTNCEDYLPTPDCKNMSSYAQNKVVCQKIK